ncbi:hypothetical protein [Streptomyces sp. H27-S2]|uniref:hypothetical protein n=1 Tax=Streptomyces antarcticus TaxID=2996458 RepID=UPI00226F625B|nr:hypothetical protein [Streptomyces sp. H27-S2]MCY0950629.1 hypothetical protein [Streptomyces sp. H27-S2]
MGLINDREVERGHLLAIKPVSARQGGLQRPANLPLVHGGVDVLAVHQEGVRGVLMICGFLSVVVRHRAVSAVAAVAVLVRWSR